MGITASAVAANRMHFLEFAEHCNAVMPEPQLVETLVQQGLTLSATAGGELERRDRKSVV